jgi:monoamine oxidase
LALVKHIFCKVITMKTFDVIIIGAGASGLMAAKEISAAGRSVCILEARNRIGGRIQTITDERFAHPVEAGAEFIHGKLEHTFQLIKKAGLDHYSIKGNVYQVMNGEWNKENDFIQRAGELEEALKKLKEDIPLKDFLTKYFPGAKNSKFRKAVIQYAEGYDAADASRLSTLAFRNEMENEDDRDFRLTHGYSALMQYLWNQCESKGVTIRLNNVVKEIHWKNQPVRIVTDQGIYKAKQVVITIPLGVWQARKGSKGTIGFIPELEEKKTAAKQLGFGGVIKLLIQFDEVFWKDKARKIGFILSDKTIPTWWTQEPDKHAMLNGWVAGPAAKKLQKLDDEAILAKGIASLSAIFQIKPGELKKKIIAVHVFNWLNDPFARGAYAWQTVGATLHRRTLQKPVDNRLFFAGEAMYQGSEMGTVEAALASGAQVAKEVLARVEIVKTETDQ